MRGYRRDYAACEHLPGTADIEQARFIRERKRESGKKQRRRCCDRVSDALRIHKAAAEHIEISFKRIFSDNRHENTARDKTEHDGAQRN